MTTFGRLAEAIGTEIRLKTDEGVYVGKVHTVNKVLQRLTLSKVKSFDEGDREISMPGLLSFQKDEIHDFEFISFPKPKIQPQKQVVPQRTSPVVTQPLPRPRPVVQEPRPPEPPLVAKVAETQNDRSRNESLHNHESGKRTSPRVVQAKDYADGRVTVASLPSGISAAPNDKNRKEKPQKLESKPKTTSTVVRANGPADVDVTKAGYCNGILTEGNDPASIWDQRIYFNDARTSCAAQDNRIPNQYVVVKRIDEDFYEMMDLILSQCVIGCGFDGISLGRHGKLSWMQVAIQELVVVFDMLSLNCEEAFQAGLKDVLLSENIIKVIHDCRQASDLLFHQYGIRLVNVFDTQVADVMASRARRFGRMPKYVRSLATCLKFYLDLTQEQVAFYEIRKASIEKDGSLWHRRPMTDFLVETMALNVRYLRELRMVTLEEMLADFTFGVDVFLHSVRDQRNEEAAKHVNGEVLPQDLHDFSYANIIASDPSLQSPRPNVGPRNPIHSPRLASIDECNVKPRNPGMQNGYASSSTNNTEGNQEGDYDGMPLLEEIVDLPELEDIADNSEMDEMPELEDLDVQSYDAVQSDRHEEPVTRGRHAAVRHHREGPKKPFESSDDETGSLDLRFENLYRKMRRAFRQNTPDVSAELIDPEALSSLRRSSLTPSVSSDCLKPPPVRSTEDRPFVDEPTLGRYAMQPKIRLENAPRWRHSEKPLTTRLNINPVGMKP